MDATLCCGQVFRWSHSNGWWYGVSRDKALRIRKLGEKLEFEGADSKFVEKYFSLDEDIDCIEKSINKDKHIDKALRAFRGLRIVRQDPWECLISYICATYKSIAAIKHMLGDLSRKFGKKISLGPMDFWAFPEPEILASAPIEGLLKCGLGYRAKYVSATSKQICDGFKIEDLRKIPYLEAKKSLMKLPGVGAKVADCVLLFSLGKTEAFPVDVWVRRVMLNRYKNIIPPDFAQKLSTKKSLSNGDYEKLNSLGRDYFGTYAGWAQEYLYHYERMHP